VEDGWREAFTTTFLGVVDIQEKSRIHSARTQSSGEAQDFCEEARGEPRRSSRSLLKSDEVLGISMTIPGLAGSAER